MLTTFILSVTYPHKLHRNELKSLLLEPLNNVCNKAPLHSIGFDHYEGSFVGHFCKEKKVEKLTSICTTWSIPCSAYAQYIS